MEICWWFWFFYQPCLSEVHSCYDNADPDNSVLGLLHLGNGNIGGVDWELIRSSLTLFLVNLSICNHPLPTQTVTTHRTSLLSNQHFIIFDTSVLLTRISKLMEAKLYEELFGLAFFCRLGWFFPCYPCELLWGRRLRHLCELGEI